MIENASQRHRGRRNRPPYEYIEDFAVLDQRSQWIQPWAGSGRRHAASIFGVHSHVLSKDIYITHSHAQGAASAWTRRGFPSKKDRRVRKQYEVTPISLSRELLTNDLKNAWRLGSMSPVPTHWDPKHTDLRDAFHTVHCRHFNLALDSSRLLVIDYRSALQVPTLRLYVKDRRLCLRSLDTLSS